jgi:Dyp-type peroxidase family
VPEGELTSFPQDFREGMVARANLLGDADESAPSSWVGPFASGVHGVLILAADDPRALDQIGRSHTERMRTHGVQVSFDQTGQTRVDQPGHEHFGFKDGVSQPGIRGVTVRRNPDNDSQGTPGQDLLWPGEFVLGYPTQIRTPAPDDEEGGNEQPGPISVSGPAWTADGSYLVFRRLRQDVAGFHRFLADAAQAQGLTTDQLGAKLVGRYPSGAPLERTADQPEGFDPSTGDPSRDDPGLLDEMRVNNFEFAEDDGDGTLVPRAAHIRKVYPRDSRTPTGLEADTQTHRILRRGIPFGQSFHDGTPADSPTGAGAPFPNDRGLLFLAYQSSIERQFEFIMARWVNEPDATEPGDGHDPIISQARADRLFTLPGGRPGHVAMMQRFVITTGGAYLFQPSLSALRFLAAPAVAGRPAPVPPAAPRPPRPAGGCPGDRDRG